MSTQILNNWIQFDHIIELLLNYDMLFLIQTVKKLISHDQTLKSKREREREREGE